MPKYKLNQNGKATTSLVIKPDLLNVIGREANQRKMSTSDYIAKILEDRKHVKTKYCVMCGSQAINDHLHGRERGVDLDLCDVCYWKKRYYEKCFEMEKQCTEMKKASRLMPLCKDPYEKEICHE